MSELRVAIVGAPNAGKSTLFNRLLGRRKALVHREPGVTRDLNEEPCDWEGRPVTLVDTGGLFPSGDSIFGDLVRRRVLEEASRADILILLVDGRRGLTPVDEELARLFRRTGRPLVLAVNKLDVLGREEGAAEFHALGLASPIPISAEHSLGLDALRDAVAHLLDSSGSTGVPPAAQPGPRSVRVAIAGRPNVGKSSLLNALLGDERAIVSEVPGTTRDAVDSLLVRGERTYRLIDTAGMRRRGKVVIEPEALSVMVARRNVEGADVVLLVMDTTEAPTLQDLHVAGVARDAHRPFIVLLNKWDLLDVTPEAAEPLLERLRRRMRFAPYAPVLTISALTGQGVGRILPQVDVVHSQAMRTLTTGRLNRWLREAVDAHHPPSIEGRAMKIFYVAQKGTNPPSFVAFTNADAPPHFSYHRYLENSLRDRFGLDRTPVILTYRKRPRRARAFGRKAESRRRRSV